jgi:hypothetical protein
MNKKMKRIIFTGPLITAMFFLFGCSVAFDLAHTGAGKSAQVDKINFFNDTNNLVSNKDSGANLPDLFYISPNAVLTKYKKIIVNDFTSITSDVGKISGLQIPEFKNIRKDLPDNIAQSFDGSIFSQCIRSTERIDYQDINSIKIVQADAILFGNISEIKSGLRLKEHGGGPGLTSIQVEIKLVDRKTGEELIKMINRSTTDGDKVPIPIIGYLANLMNKAKKDVIAVESKPIIKEEKTIEPNTSKQIITAEKKVEPTQAPIEKSPSESQVSKSLIVIKTASIRAEPNTKSKIITNLKTGTKVEYLGKSGNWFNIKLSTGVTGWVFNNLVKEEK